VAPICHAHDMALNRPSGPPANRRQLEHLLELLIAAGYEGFRDARGPMGFTQRQGNGNFTREEADAFIAELEGDDHDPSAPSGAPSSATAAPRLSPDERAARALSAEVLAAELQRRGWVVMEP